MNNLTTNLHPWPCMSGVSVATELCVKKKKSKGSPYSITEYRVPELVPVLSSQPAAVNTGMDPESISNL